MEIRSGIFKRGKKVSDWSCHGGHHVFLLPVAVPLFSVVLAGKQMRIQMDQNARMFTIYN
jgi:hypothetical protein